MEHTNYCRQMIRQMMVQTTDAQTRADIRQAASHLIDLATCSQKFLLPAGGRLFDDLEFRALDTNEPLRLPFPFIALEFTRTQPESWEEGHTPYSKSIVFARERDDRFIAMNYACFVTEHKIWAPGFELLIPRTDYLQRQNGSVQYRLYGGESLPVGADVEGCADEIGALMSTLNALSCMNVRAEISKPKPAKKLKGALPFDSYYILTVDCPKGDRASHGGHDNSARHPREHLRRGHIRRLQDGRRLWINATVVNPGVGGKIRKDYSIRDPRVAACEFATP